MSITAAHLSLFRLDLCDVTHYCNYRKISHICSVLEELVGDKTCSVTFSSCAHPNELLSVDLYKG